TQPRRAAASTTSTTTRCARWDISDESVYLARRRPKRPPLHAGWHMLGRSMRRASFLLFFAASAAFAQQHPMTFEDMLSLHRIGAPQVSPDGKWIAYDASTPDLAANKSASAVYLIAASGGASKQLTDGSGPAWSPDGKSIAFVKDLHAYLYDVAAGTSRKVTAL